MKSGLKKWIKKTKQLWSTKRKDPSWIYYYTMFLLHWKARLIFFLFLNVTQCTSFYIWVGIITCMLQNKTCHHTEDYTKEHTPRHRENLPIHPEFMSTSDSYWALLGSSHCQAVKNDPRNRNNNDQWPTDCDYEKGFQNLGASLQSTEEKRTCM